MIVLLCLIVGIWVLCMVLAIVIDRFIGWIEHESHHGHDGL